MNLKSIVFLIHELRNKKEHFEKEQRELQAAETEEQIKELKDSLFALLRSASYIVEMEEDYKISFRHSQQAKSMINYS